MTTVYPKKYAHGFVVLCFVVVMQSFIMNSHEVFINIHQGCFAGTGAIVRLPQCQWSKPEWYGKISQCINTTKHSKAKNVCIFLGIYCLCRMDQLWSDNLSLYHQAVIRLSVNRVKSRSREIGYHTARIALQFNRHLGNATADVPVKYLGDWKSLKPDLAVASLHEILR